MNGTSCSPSRTKSPSASPSSVSSTACSCRRGLRVASGLGEGPSAWHDRAEFVWATRRPRRGFPWVVGLFGEAFHGPQGSSLNHQQMCLSSSWVSLITIFLEVPNARAHTCTCVHVLARTRMSRRPSRWQAPMTRS